MWLIALNGGDVQSFQRVHQLLAHSQPHCCSRHACVLAYVRCGVGGKLHQIDVSYAGVVNATVYTCNHTHHRVYICARVGAFYLFVLSNLSLHACVSQVFFNTCMRVWEGIESGGVSSMFMFGACYWRGWLCFGRGGDRGFVLYISLFLRVLGYCVLVYTRRHTQDTWVLDVSPGIGRTLESRKSPDELKRSLHVDCICVQSIFVYIYAGLRVLMIWANYLFPVHARTEKVMGWGTRAFHEDDDRCLGILPWSGTPPGSDIIPGATWLPILLELDFLSTD